MKKTLAILLALLAFLGVFCCSIYVDKFQEADKYNPEYFEKTTSEKNDMYVSLPETIYVKKGSVFTAYFRNILSQSDTFFWIGSHSGLTTKYYDEYFTISSIESGTFDLPWKVFDESYNLLESGTLKIIATENDPIGTTKVIIVGDSTVNDGTMIKKVVELYENAGATLISLGTRNTLNQNHEGRGGWSAKMYCTIENDGNIENPFYNNGFDFAHYMSSQGYTDVQAVAIQLGINDVFQIKGGDVRSYDSGEILDYIDQMVASILDYDDSIKVIINLPVTPNSNGTSFTETYGTSQIYWYYNHNIIRFAIDLREYFSNNSSVVISANNCVLDTKTQIRDGVHPTSEGYNALGERLYDVLVSVLDYTN